MLRRLFLEHPESLGESYGAHFRTALGVSGALLGAGAACLVHAFLPAAFQTTGSRTIRRLDERLRGRLPMESRT